MSDLHIGDFYRDTARILVRLYNQFPRPQMLFVEEICGAAEPDEFGLPGERHHACFSTLIWLAEERYLSYADTIHQAALDQVVLTERGFRLLSCRSQMPWLEETMADDDLPPSLMAASHANVAQLRRALASGSSILLEQTVHQLLGTAP
jgi:hypothetical protein